MKIKEFVKFPNISLSSDWYNYLMEHNGALENYCNMKYGSIVSMFDEVPNDEEYVLYYFLPFIYSIDDKMKHYYKLFTGSYDPYENVTELTTETMNYGEKKTTHNFGATHGEGLSKISADDSSVLIDNGKSVTDVDEYENEDTENAHNDTKTINRHGNIGTVDPSTLGENELKYAKKLNLYDLFIREWLEVFSKGVWE